MKKKDFVYIGPLTTAVKLFQTTRNIVCSILFYTFSRRTHFRETFCHLFQIKINRLILIAVSAREQVTNSHDMDEARSFLNIIKSMAVWEMDTGTLWHIYQNIIHITLLKLPWSKRVTICAQTLIDNHSFHGGDNELKIEMFISHL